jgi:hypothetical protein
MKYEFHPEALAEYDEASRYFAGRQPGLELRFIEAVEQAVYQILESPRQWRIFEDDVRRCLTHVFPYAVLYTIEPDYVLIIASCTVVASQAIGDTARNKVSGATTRIKHLCQKKSALSVSGAWAQTWRGV